MSLTKKQKEKIKREKIAFKLEEILEEMGILNDCSIFVNGIERRYLHRESRLDEPKLKGPIEYETIKRKPTDFCKYTSDQFVGLAYKNGILYSIMNNKLNLGLRKIIEEKIKKFGIKNYIGELIIEGRSRWYSHIRVKK